MSIRIKYAMQTHLPITCIRPHNNWCHKCSLVINYLKDSNYIFPSVECTHFEVTKQDPQKKSSFRQQKQQECQGVELLAACFFQKDPAWTSKKNKYDLIFFFKYILFARKINVWHFYKTSTLIILKDNFEVSWRDYGNLDWRISILK